MRILILGGTTGGAAAGATAGRACGPRRDAVARGPHRGASRATGAGAHRRFRRRAGACRLSVERAHRRADRCDASLRRRHLRQCGRRPRPRPACRCWRCDGRPGSRAPATAGPRSPMCGRRRPRSETRRAGCSSRSAARSLRPSPARRSTTISCAASIRSIRRSRCRMRSMSPARGPFAEADDRALLEQHRHRGHGRQEQRRHRDLRQDRGGARARPARDHAAPAGAAGGAGGRDRGGCGRLARSCARTLRRRAACRRAACGRDARSCASPPSPR